MCARSSLPALPVSIGGVRTSVLRQPLRTFALLLLPYNSNAKVEAGVRGY